MRVRDEAERVVLTVVISVASDGSLVERRIPGVRSPSRAHRRSRHQGRIAVSLRADAPTVGGCVWVREGSSIVLDKVVMTGCSAQYGSGLGVEDSRARVANTAMHRNGVVMRDESEVQGGGAYFRNCSRVEMENVTLSDNFLVSTNVDGGGVYVEKSSEVLLKSVAGVILTFNLQRPNSDFRFKLGATP